MGETVQSNLVALAIAACFVAAPAVFGSIAKPSEDQAPVVRRFHPEVPIVHPDRGGGMGGQRSTLLERSIDVSLIDSNTTIGQIPPAAPANRVLDLLFPPGTQVRGYAKGAYVNSMYPDWTPTSLVPGLLMANDFAMVVAVRNTSGSTTGQSTPMCRADFDRSGQIGVADIFSFLSEWFSGCP